MAEIEKPDTPTNVVDDKLSTFDTTLNSADGNVEFYIKHQGKQVLANDIKYNPNLGSGTEKFIPGFYGEPVGDVSAETMGIKIQDNPVSNYYKVQVNTNNLLITQPDGFLGNQIDKVDWNIFAKETGISLSDIKNPKTQNVNSLINELKQLGLDDGTIAEGFRKSGIEGFVELKGDWREVVLIDPNDNLGIGSKLNIEDATEVEFLNNQSKVNQIDELIIKPTNIVDMKNNNIDLLNDIEKQNNLPKGSFSKLGAILDPISEGLELALKAAGLGKIANWWIKAEAANFLAGIMRAGAGGLAQAQLGQSAALMGEKDIVSQTEENILSTAGQIFSQQMKLSPSVWLESKYAKSSLGEGKTPTEQMYNKVVEALKLGGK